MAGADQGGDDREQEIYMRMEITEQNKKPEDRIDHSDFIHFLSHVAWVRAHSRAGLLHRDIKTFE